MKKYAGWIEKRWRESLTFVLTSHQFTSGYRCQWCKDKKYQLEIAGDWEKLPTDIRLNIELYANLLNYKGELNETRT